MSGSWWAVQSFDEGAVMEWRLGALRLAARRTAREWNIAHHWESVEDPEPGWSLRQEAALSEEGREVARFVFASTGRVLELLPALADRPVITSPRVPLFVSPGEETTLFVGSPLWVQVKVEEQILREVPIQRPSDTWFGPSTREGELCYAARTLAVLEVDNLPLLSRRSVTPVRVRNRASVPLQIERLKLPVPYLSLFATPAGRLWTETVTIDRSDPSEIARVRVQPGPPAKAQGAELITTPREQAEESSMMRVFSTFESLFRAIGDDDD